jgi:rhodanese-related sulfurtransferase
MSVKSISPSHFWELTRAGQTELIDVRTPAEYREVHVEYARNVPLDQLDPKSVMAARGGAVGQPLYLVCKGGQRSAKACEEFVKAGFDNVFTVEGGTDACIAAGLPIARGKKAISLERQVRIAAGSLVLVGVVASLWFQPLIWLSGFIGAGLVFAGVTDTCGMGMLLARMRWNK